MNTDLKEQSDLGPKCLQQALRTIVVNDGKRFNQYCTFLFDLAV